MAKRLVGFSWRRELIREVQGAVRDELAAVGDEPRGRLAAAMVKIDASAADRSSEGMLRRYILVVSALLLHERDGGLELPQIKVLTRTAIAILRIQKVQPPKSKIGFLFGDLFRALSQIHRKQGKHWLAAWDQQIASYMTQGAADDLQAFDAMCFGIRSLRLGHARPAAEALAHAEALGLSSMQLARARLERVKALRLSGDREAAMLLIASTDGLELGVAERTELAWERLCVGLEAPPNLAPLVASSLRGRPHHGVDYVLELYLWSRAVPSMEWLKRLPNVAALAQKHHLKLPKRHPLIKFVTTFDTCYDFEVPFAVRFERLGKTLSSVKSLFSVDKELLVLAAAARWLVRSKSPSLAGLVYGEYQSLSLKLTAGRSADAIGLGSGINVATWRS